MKKITLALIVTISTLLMVSLTIFAPIYATPKDDVCKGVALTGGSCDSPANGPSVQSVITDVVNILSFVVGFVSVVMIMVGGLKYITSNGDTNSISSAKQTILGAIIGLVIVAVAQAVVRFVIRRFTTPG